MKKVHELINEAKRPVDKIAIALQKIAKDLEKQARALTSIDREQSKKLIKARLDVDEVAYNIVFPKED